MTRLERTTRFAEAIETITRSQSKFSKRDQIWADKVRRLQHVSGFPSDEKLVYSVMTNDIRNNPISRRDIQICDEMLGKSVYATKGKKNMRQSNPIDDNNQVVEVSPSMLTHYMSVKLAADILHVNDVPFLISAANHLHYGTATAVDNIQSPTLEIGLRIIVRSYYVRGLNVGIMFLGI